MKSLSRITPALDPDATPQSGGSYIRQPDGSLERALTAAPPAAAPALAPEPTAAPTTHTKE